MGFWTIKSLTLAITKSILSEFCFYFSNWDTSLLILAKLLKFSLDLRISWKVLILSIWEKPLPLFTLRSKFSRMWIYSCKTILKDRLPILWNCWSISDFTENSKKSKIFCFKFSVFVLEFLNLFENLTRQLIAIFLSCSGIKINEFVRQFLGISNELVESLSVRETQGLETCLTLPVLNYLKNMALINALNAHVEKVRNTAVNNSNNESVLGIFYDNILTVNKSDSDDLFVLKNSFNKKFNDIYSLLNK